MKTPIKATRRNKFAAIINGMRYSSREHFCRCFFGPIRLKEIEAHSFHAGYIVETTSDRDIKTFLDLRPDQVEEETTQATNEHTSGPWEQTDPTTVCATFNRNGQRRVIASTSFKDSYKADLPEEKANATLIAAAPEMFKVLQECAQFFQDTEEGTIGARVQQAINKAKGK